MGHGGGKGRTENNRKDTPQAQCLPNAVLRFGPLIEFVQSKHFLIIIADDDSPGFHQVYLDGRPHPADPYEWYGHNTGRWEGDTPGGGSRRLQRSGLAGPGIASEYREAPRGGALSASGFGPPGNRNYGGRSGRVAKPYTIKRVADLAPDQEIHEYICPENNQDIGHMVGK